MKARRIAETGKRLKEELRAADAAMFTTANPSIGGFDVRGLMRRQSGFAETTARRGRETTRYSSASRIAMPRAADKLIVLRSCRIQPHCCSNASIFSRASSSGDDMKARRIAETGKRLKEELRAADAAMFATANPSVGGFDV